MKPIKHFGDLAVVLLAAVFFVACQNTIVDSPSASVDSETALTEVNEFSRFVPVVQEFQKKLEKKGGFTHSRMIPAKAGGVLGGPQTAGCYVEIPRDALGDYGNTFFAFSVYLGDGGELIFDIEPRGHDGKFWLDENATLAVPIDLLEGIPNVVVNIEGTEVEDWTEVFGVNQNETHYTAEVDHFSKWSWGILE